MDAGTTGLGDVGPGAGPVSKAEEKAEGQAGGRGCAERSSGSRGSCEDGQLERTRLVRGRRGVEEGGEWTVHESLRGTTFSTRVAL